MTDNRIDVFVLAQNKLLREGLGKLLRREGDIRVVATIAPDSTFHRQIVGLNPDVLLLELGVLAHQEPDFISTILRHFQDLKIVMISMDQSEDHSECYLRSSVMSRVPQDAGVAEVLEVVRKAPRGGV